MPDLPPVRRAVRRRVPRRAAAFATAGLLLGACSAAGDAVGDLPGGEGGAPGELRPDEPIVLGAVSTTSGPDARPDATDAARAVFRALNERGGIDGHPVTYLVADDAGSVESASAAAHQLVEVDEVAALVGGASSVECAVNAAYYERHGVRNLGASLRCGADTPAVAALDSGPFVAALLSLSELLTGRGVSRVCAVARAGDVAGALGQSYVPLWEAATGLRLHMLRVVEDGDDPAAVLAELASRRCDGLYLDLEAASYPVYAAALPPAFAASGDDAVAVIMAPSGYSDAVLKSLGAAGEGWMTSTSLLPVLGRAGRSGELDEFRRLMGAASVPVTPDALAGYLAATAVLDALGNIDGPVTRASLGAAIATIDRSSDLLADPLRWVPFRWPRQLNTAVRFVQVRNGAFETAGDWVRWSPS